MKKTILVLALFLVFSLFWSTALVQGANEPNAPTEPYKYHLMVPLPTASGTATSTTGIVDYIRLLYFFAIGIAGVLAMAMIIYAGFRWATAAGNYAAISDAKNRLSGAILGLVLLLASYLILNTINPALVNLKEPLLQFMIWDQPFGTGGTPGGGGGGVPQYCTDDHVTGCGGYQNAAHISDCNSNPCGVTGNCFQDGTRCSSCSTIISCSQYMQDTTCTADPCGFGCSWNPMGVCEEHH